MQVENVYLKTNIPGDAPRKIDSIVFELPGNGNSIQIEIDPIVQHLTRYQLIQLGSYLILRAAGKEFSSEEGDEF